MGSHHESIDQSRLSNRQAPRLGRNVVGLSVEEGRLYNNLDTVAIDITGDVTRNETDLIFSGQSFVKLEGVTDNLAEFTLEVTVAPDQLDDQQNVLESQDPPVSLYIDADGTVVGTVHTEEGWQEVRSGDVTLTPGERSQLRLSRDRDGIVRLEVDREETAVKRILEPLESVGDRGFTVGADRDGSFNFTGRIGDIRIRDAAVSAADLRVTKRHARELEERLSNHFGMPVDVEIDAGTVDRRLDQVKSIMHAAGVEDASQLSTLTIDEPTTLKRDTVMVAPRKSVKPAVDWSEFADRVASLPDDRFRAEFAANLINRNSRDILHDDEFIRSAIVERSGITSDVFDSFDDNEPAKWPGTANPSYSVMSLKTLPVDSAVIIAGTLDLRDTRLRIEPAVSTLYVIAEKVICGDSAEITWRRPGGSTPARNRDSSKDGRSWSGVHTGDDKHGLPGGDGRSGISGVNGANGRDAPSIELWVKELTAIPNIDLKGEQGIRGGRGQPGGRGGNGAQGKAGKWRWGIGGKKCWKQPGHGGDGGDGGDGGRGGRGGNGGSGADIAIGVLEDTLEEAVTSRNFKLNNDGGDPGRGGPGGPRGPGGRGGPHGNAHVGNQKVCKQGKPGANGQHGRRGRTGPDGRRGSAGEVTFFEFTEESWNEQLTKPWITEVSPEEAFPGDALLLSGPRFADTDTVVLGDDLNPTILSDGRLEVEIPEAIGGGRKDVRVKRHDGAESNELQVWIRPRLDSFPDDLTPGTTATLEGRAFLEGAAVLIDGEAVSADVDSERELTFEIPETDATGADEQSVTIAVRNPDGYVSDEENATIPEVRKNGFQIGVHDFAFSNFKQGSPSWDTFEETFGAFEVWHEQLDPVFGHPILTPAFYAFYYHFLKGEDRGGLATGFCTSLASVALDEFWSGSDDTYDRYDLDAETRRYFTAVHGRLLSRESLTRMHDQSREGVARVEQSVRIIEHAFQQGSHENAPVLFFIPSGAVWDAEYMEDLEDSHAVVPTRIQYPSNRDGDDLDGVTLYVWDNNHPIDEGEADARNCRLELFRDDGDIHFEYYNGDRSSNPKFASQDGLTLGTQTLNEYLLSDVDMPFSGPFGLTRFIVDFLLSPADLKVTDSAGRITGVDAGQLKAEIPDSHPVYLRRRAFLLPMDTAFTRTITGEADGTYDYQSLSPRDTSISLEDVTTSAGEEDVLRVNADGTQIRFEPGSRKSLDMVLGRQKDGQIRGLAVSGIAGSPDEEVDVTLTEDLSAVRVGNRGDDIAVDVRLIGMDTETATNMTIDRRDVPLPQDNDLAVLVSDWDKLEMEVRTVPFEN